GPHMTRYLCTAPEVVKLVRTAIANCDMFSGKIVTRAMKSVLIGCMLELVVREKGGKWQRGDVRPGERQHEFLVGEPELSHTEVVDLEGVKHYVLSPNVHPLRQLPAPISSE